ncbi:MAG TPA: cupin domain-containing protein [Caulobacteraceae bacterium]
MISTLADLIAPLAEDEFARLLREPRPRLLRGADPDRYCPLVDWDGFVGAVESGAIPPGKVRLTKDAAPLPPVFYRDKAALRPQAAERVLAQGGSLVVYGVEPYLPAFGALCASIAAQVGERILAGVIATEGPGGALPPHYDAGDMLIVQVEGAKRWLIEDRPFPHPAPGRSHRDDGGAGELVVDAVLSAGDALFLPAGYRHRCENQGGRSLHAGIFFFPLTPLRALELIARRLSADPQQRAPLRFGAADAAEVEADLKARLAAAVDAASLKSLLAAHMASEASLTRLLLSAGLDVED